MTAEQSGASVRIVTIEVRGELPDDESGVLEEIQDAIGELETALPAGYAVTVDW